MSAVIVSECIDVSRDDDQCSTCASRGSEETRWRAAEEEDEEEVSPRVREATPPATTSSIAPGVGGASVIKGWWDSRLRSQRVASAERPGKAGGTPPPRDAGQLRAPRRSGGRATPAPQCSAVMNEEGCLSTPRSTGRRSVNGLTDSPAATSLTRAQSLRASLLDGSATRLTTTRRSHSIGSVGAETGMERHALVAARPHRRASALTRRSTTATPLTKGAAGPTVGGALVAVAAASSSLFAQSRTAVAGAGAGRRKNGDTAREHICSLEAHPQCSPLSKSLFSTRFLLPSFDASEPKPSLTVVLDLDETLVSNRNTGHPQAVLRPYCLHVLNALRHMAGLEIVLWTASTKETATPVVAQLYRSGDIFDEIIFRNNLWFTEPIHTKDLRLLGRDLDRAVIVDNSANCCKLNPRNAILVDDFHGFCREDDASLVNVYYMIEALLKSAAEGVNVRDGLRRLASEGHLCHSVIYPLQQVWRSLPLSEITPLKIPPCGKFVKANRPPPSRSIMKYWTM